MILDYQDDVFSVTLTGCSRPVGNVRYESEVKARELYAENPNIVLALSGGLDGQVVLHSFVSQGLPIKCATMRLAGYNNFEYKNALALRDKYGVELEVIDIDPYALKEEFLAEYEQTGIPPFQLMHKRFLEQLPGDHTFIQGLDGPEFVSLKGKWYLLETAHSFVNSRLRALQLVKRTGKIVNWEKTSELYSSLLNDDIIRAYHDSYNYINNNGLVFRDGKEITVVNHWDLYMKPLVYAKHWGKELEYFGKYQGPEEIDWIMNRRWHRYDLNRVFIPVDEMRQIYSTPGAVKTYTEIKR